MSAGADSPAAWRVLAGAGLASACGVPALFGSTFGLFMVPLQQSQGWGRADIAFSLTLTTAISWAAVLLTGWLADRTPLRPLLLAGVVLGAANLAAFSLVGPPIWHWHVLVIALAFTTIGASPVVLAKLVQSWFESRLGVAFGILFASGAVGSVLHPLVVSAVIQREGWRAGFLALGAIGLVGGVVAVLLVRRRTAEPEAGDRGPPLPASKRSANRSFLAEPTWWTLALWNLLFAFGGGCIMVHFAALLHDRGVGAMEIGLAVSLIGAGLFAGNLAAGWLADRAPPRDLAWLLMLLPLTAATLMLIAQGYAVMLLAAGMLGLASGSDGALSAYLSRWYFGAERYGRVHASQLIATAVGGGLAPWLSGLMRDRTGDYTLSLGTAVAAFALATVVGRLLPVEGHVAPMPETPAPALA